MISYRLLSFIWPFFICLNLSSQTESEDMTKDKFLGFGVSYAVDFSSGDLADRFGYSFHTSFSADFLSPKLKGFWGFEGQIQFGDQVKEDVLAPLRTEQGILLGFNEGAAEVFLRRRGIYLGLYINKIVIPLANEYSGVAIGLGAGLWQHNIRIQDENNNATQLSGDYSKGYDRNTRGPALKQSLLFQNIGAKSNFNIGINIMEGFTKSVRKVNFDNPDQLLESRLDLMISLEAKWILPIFTFGPAKEIFY